MLITQNIQRWRLIVRTMLAQIRKKIVEKEVNSRMSPPSKIVLQTFKLNGNSDYCQSAIAEGNEYYNWRNWDLILSLQKFEVVIFEKSVWCKLFHCKCLYIRHHFPLVKWANKLSKEKIGAWGYFNLFFFFFFFVFQKFAQCRIYRRLESAPVRNWKTSYSGG